MNNESGLRPLGRAVLVEPREAELKTTMIELPPSVRDRSILIEQRVAVIAIGPLAWKDEGQPRAIPGDLVMVTKFAGAFVQGPKDGKQYRLVNDLDIFCGIEEGA